jgi:hypothetical protein
MTVNRIATATAKLSLFISPHASAVDEMSGRRISTTSRLTRSTDSALVASRGDFQGFQNSRSSKSSR